MTPESAPAGSGVPREASSSAPSASAAPSGAQDPLDEAGERIQVMRAQQRTLSGEYLRLGDAAPARPTSRVP
ncbi:MAG: hypothetical protein IPK67_20005 [Planctomycetes bacterium]|nr:hypothetical protein [Planctomycetota bacterium]